MKHTLLIISIILFGINCFGQVKSEKVKGLKITEIETSSENDTIIKVFYKNEVLNDKKPAYFVNKKPVNEGVLRTINPNEIINLNIEKGDIEVNNVKYYGKIFIETKTNYNPKLISLNSLKTKYTNLKDNPTIFKIDNVIVNADYDNFLVDEKFILKIIVERLEIKGEHLKVNFVYLITKTEENIKKSKEIMIRGKDEFTINK